MAKKILLIFAVAFLLLPYFSRASANQDKETTVYFFWGDGCSHCEKEKIFLEKINDKYPEVEIRSFEVWKNKENREIFKEVAEKLNANVTGVPLTVVGDKYFIGWYDEGVTGKAIESVIAEALEKGCRDITEEVIAEKECREKNEKSEIPEKIKVPVLGEIKISDFSLPALTLIFGGIDGFNPCAMWALLFLITLLLGMKDRKRMWILGTAFIAGSAAVYFLFMAAWLNLVLFLGIITWVRVAIGAVAIGAGTYNLREFWVNKNAACETGGKKKTLVFEKLKTVVRHNSFLLALAGIVLLAFSVNLVEIICSAGLPAVYTQVLALSGLPSWQYYVYIFFYILVYMVDDLFVFFAAMTTLRVTGITVKYTRASFLIGGVLMLAIGLLLIFKPDWLTFG